MIYAERDRLNRVSHAFGRSAPFALIADMHSEMENRYGSSSSPLLVEAATSSLNMEMSSLLLLVMLVDDAIPQRAGTKTLAFTLNQLIAKFSMLPSEAQQSSRLVIDVNL